MKATEITLVVVGVAAAAAVGVVAYRYMRGPVATPVPASTPAQGKSKKPDLGAALGRLAGNLAEKAIDKYAGEGSASSGRRGDRSPVVDEANMSSAQAGILV